MKLIPVGGYNEFGRNMTALQEKNTLIIDMGLRIDALMEKEDYDMSSISREELIQLGAIPEPIDLGSVIGIVISHAHLDHIGSAPKLAPLYDADVFGTPFTIELLRRMLLDEKKYHFHRKLVTVLPGNTVQIGEFTVEFIQASHSIPDAALIFVKSGEHSVLYASDFKFDDNPVVGHKTNERRLKEIGDEGVDLMIFDTTRTDRPGKTPSESVARQMIFDTLKNAGDAEAIIATCFASHSARIQTLMDAARKLGRIPVLLGRSMRRYSQVAVKLNFLKPVKYYARQQEINSVFRRVYKNPRKYLIICTGNQAEPNSVMDRLVSGQYDYKLTPEDWVLFCSDVIPNEINQRLRGNMDLKIKEEYGSKIFTGLHASGHCSREDTRHLIQLVRPKHIVPTHGSGDKMQIAAELGAEEGYKLGETIHVLSNGQALEIY
jgi:ribonuclease J